MTRSVKIYFFCALVIMFTSCGFKPMYKATEDNFVATAYSVDFQNDPGYVIKNKILESYSSSSSDSLHTIHLTINQKSTPLLTNTNGTVSKYRIEVTIYFEVHKSDSENIIYSDITRGFSEYFVQTSEIQTDEKLKQAVEIATHEASQMMSIKIKNNIFEPQ